MPSSFDACSKIYRKAITNSSIFQIPCYLWFLYFLGGILNLIEISKYVKKISPPHFIRLLEVVVVADVAFCLVVTTGEVTSK